MVSALTSLYTLAKFLVLQASASPILSTGVSVDSNGNNYIKLDFDVHKIGGSQSNETQFKRDNTGSVSLQLINEKILYLTYVQLGTPAQNVGVQLDTGSSDLWVESSSNPHCGEVECDQYGTFNPSDSSSYEDLNQQFSISYLDYTYAKGNWATDDMLFGSTKLSNFQFGYASDANSSTGVLGVGFTTLESTANTYNNLPAQLASKGIISKAAYSLYLNSADAEAGSILFGAIDNAKYSGSLVTLSIPPSEKYNGYYDLQVQFDSITLPSGETLTINAGPAVLDSGTTLSTLPADIIQNIASSLQFTYNSNAGVYIRECSSIESSGKIFTYKLEDALIEVPYSQLIASLQNTDGSTSEYCALGFISNDQVILGDNFLRSAYVVYDLTDKQVSLAQVKYTTSESISVIS